MGDHRFQAGSTSSGSRRVNRWPSAGRMAPNRPPTAARTSLAWLVFSVMTRSAGMGERSAVVLGQCLPRISLGEETAATAVVETLNQREQKTNLDATANSALL